MYSCSPRFYISVAVVFQRMHVATTFGSKRLGETPSIKGPGCVYNKILQRPLNKSTGYLLS